MFRCNYFYVFDSLKRIFYLCVIILVLYVCNILIATRLRVRTQRIYNISELSREIIVHIAYSNCKSARY